MMEDAVVTLRGKRWKVCSVPSSKIPNQDGECDHPNVVHKEIRIRNNLLPKRNLEVLIHEALHACLWDLSEEAVAETALDITSMLWRMGYRNEKY